MQHTVTLRLRSNTVRVEQQLPQPPALETFPERSGVLMLFQTPQCRKSNSLLTC